MQYRTIEKIIDPLEVMEGAGVRLIRSFPTRALDFPDPFLLWDHFGSENPEDYLAGFPMHPHRGIETVTYMLDGKVSHKDSLGNAGTIGAGDVQWMTSGGGIMHEEMPKPEEGKMEGFQLWVNLPSVLKISQPRYQEYSSDTIPRTELKNGVSIKVIAGETNGIHGPVKEIAIQPLYLDVRVPANCEFEHVIPAGHQVLIYIYRGKCYWGNNSETSAPKMLVFGDGNAVKVRTGGETVRFILMAGKPIKESIVRYGPFVMNTEAEIRQALEDLRNGSFVKK